MMRLKLCDEDIKLKLDVLLVTSFTQQNGIET